MKKNYLPNLSNTLVVSSKTILKTVLFLLFSSVAMAQAPTFNDDVNDQAAPAPIDSYLVVLCIMGILLGLNLLRKKEPSKTHSI